MCPLCVFFQHCVNDFSLRCLELYIKYCVWVIIVLMYAQCDLYSWIQGWIEQFSIVFMLASFKKYLWNISLQNPTNMNYSMSILLLNWRSMDIILESLHFHRELLIWFHYGCWWIYLSSKNLILPSIGQISTYLDILKNRLENVSLPRPYLFLLRNALTCWCELRENLSFLRGHMHP
jgi:hypothetical protein